MFLRYRGVYGFTSPLYQSYKLVTHLSRKAHIDESHNEIHSKEVLFWATTIMQRLPVTLPPLECSMIGHCTLLHDMLDRKYNTAFSETVKRHLDQYFSSTMTEDMMRIMQDMSYSKTVVSDPIHPEKKRFVLPPWLHTSSCTVDRSSVFHIVREADLLSSYNLARMVYYRRHFYPQATSQWIRDEMMQLYDMRMGALVRNGVYHHSTTQTLATSLEEVSRLKLNMVPTMDLINDDLDLLKIIDGSKLDIHVLLQSLAFLSKP